MFGRYCLRMVTLKILERLVCKLLLLRWGWLAVGITCPKQDKDHRDAFLFALI